MIAEAEAAIVVLYRLPAAQRGMYITQAFEDLKRLKAEARDILGTPGGTDGTGGREMYDCDGGDDVEGYAYHPWNWGPMYGRGRRAWRWRGRHHPVFMRPRGYMINNPFMWYYYPTVRLLLDAV